jgi:WD40 repeat protein/HEAT repeat protein
MKYLKEKTFDKSIIIMLLGGIYFLLMTFFVPKNMILLWMIALLILLNFVISLKNLLHQGTINWGIIFVNILQLALFARMFVLIYDVLGHQHYSYIIEPRWFDWIQLVAAHVLRAVDLLDFLGEYHIHLQNVTHNSTLAGLGIFSMHLIVDIFLFGGILVFINKHFSTTQNSSINSPFIESFKTKLALLKHLTFWGLILSIILILIVAIVQGWHFRDWFLWPLDNILRTIDFGDAFQIFDWRLHSVKMGIGLATLAVFFRLVISFYVLEQVNSLYLFLLGGRGKTVHELGKICASSDASEEEIKIAAKALVKFGKNAVTHLITALEINKIGEKRRIIVETLGEIGPIAQEAIPALVKSLADSDGNVRWAAAIALEERIEPQWQLTEEAIKTLPELVKLLGTDETPVRKAVVDILGKIGQGSLKVVQPLVIALTDQHQDVRHAAANYLEKVDPQWRQREGTRKIIPYIIKIAEKHKNPTRCAAAAATLEILYPQWYASQTARSAVSSLIKALVDSQSDIRQYAKNAIEKLAPHWLQHQAAHKTIPYFVKALANKNREVRLTAESILEKIDPLWFQSQEARYAIPELIKIHVCSETHENRQTARSILNKIAKQWWKIEATQHVIHDLVIALINNNPEIRNLAETTLDLINTDWRNTPEARNAIPEMTLIASTSDNNKVRWIARETLKKLGKDPEIISQQLSKPKQTLPWFLKPRLLVAIALLIPITIWFFGGSEFKLHQTLNEHSGRINAISFNTNGSLLASASNDKTIKVWRISTGISIQTLIGHNKPVTSVSFSPDGKLLASGSRDKTIKIWELNTSFINNEAIFTLEGHEKSVNLVKFSPDSQIIASVSRDEIKLWKVSTGKLLHSLKGHEGMVTSFAFSPDKSLLASVADKENMIKLWDVSTGKELDGFIGHEKPVTALSFTPDGSKLVSASRDGTVRQWKVDALRELYSQNIGYLNFPLSLSPNAKMLATIRSGNYNIVIILWKVGTKQPIQRIYSYELGRVSSVSFSPDNNMFAIAAGKIVQLWSE